MSKDKSTSDTEAPVAFPPALVHKLITQHIQEQREDTTSLPTLSPEAADAVGELLKQFVMEARLRASMAAEIEQEATLQVGENTIQVRSDHCTKISAEMLMDFS